MTIGGLNEVKVFRTDDSSQVAIIPVGKLPHGIWPSGDGSRIYVGLENADGMTAIDTVTNKVIASPETAQRFRALGYTISQDSQAQFDQFYRAEIARWKDVAQKAHVQPLD